MTDDGGVRTAIRRVLEACAAFSTISGLPFRSTVATITTAEFSALVESGACIGTMDLPPSEITRTLAYRLWERRGRPLWDDQHDWYEAQHLTTTSPAAAALDIGT